MPAIYFAKSLDTAIAAENDDFIAALEDYARGDDGSSRSVRVVSDPLKADLVVIDERYAFRTWRYADTLAECAFVRRYVARIAVINHDSYARTYLPGVYASLEQSRLSDVSAISGPYKRDLWQVPVPSEHLFTPTRLFTFRGTLHTHPVRRKLLDALQAHPQADISELPKSFHDHTPDDQRDYIDRILSAHFVLCPRGLSPNSYRLFETMQLGRCPVIISDDWIPPEGPDWENCSLRVAEKDIASIPDVLAQHAENAETLGRNAAEAWSRFFSWPNRFDFFLSSLLKINQALQSTDPAQIDERLKYWKSRKFRTRYDWTLAGRIQARISRLWRVQ